MSPLFSGSAGWGSGLGGSGGGGYGGGGFGSGAGGDAGTATTAGYGSWSMPPDYATTSAAASASAPSAIDLLGFIMSDGHLDWPLGVRILAPSDQTLLLQRRIDSMLVLMAYEAANGQLDSTLVQESRRSIAELRSRLDGRSTDLAQPTYQEARWFLDQLDRSLNVVN